MADSTSRSLIAEDAPSAPFPVPALSAWFAHSQPAPDRAFREWEETGVALLPLGSCFDAVRLPEALVRAATGVTAPQDITTRLSWLIEGPVIYDGRTLGGSYYALTKSCRTRIWKHQDTTPRLSHGTYLGVPRLDRTEPPGTYWIVLPRFVGDLCEPAAVAAVVNLGQSATEEEQVVSEPTSIPTARRREELIHQSYLAHLGHCSPCQTETTPCVDGERMQHALRTVRTVGRNGTAH